MQKKRKHSIQWGINFMRVKFDLFGAFFAVGRVWSQLGGEHSKSTLNISVWCVCMSWCKLHHHGCALLGMVFTRTKGFVVSGICCKIHRAGTQFFGFLYRPCGAAMQQRNPAPPQPPGRSMWLLPCKIPKSLQRHLVPVWESRWHHWQGWLSACFSF